MKALHLCGLLQNLYSITNSCNLLKLRSIESVMLTTISSYVIPFSSCLQSFPASGSFQMSYFFETGGQSIGVPFLVISPSSEYSGLISFKMEWLDLLAVQGLSRVFSNTIVQKYQFLNIQPSLWSNSHIHTWQNHSLDYTDLCRKSYVSAFYFFNF